MNIDLAILHESIAKETIEIATLLQRELDEDSEMTQAREKNYRLLQLVLERPTLGLEEYSEILYNQYGIDSANVRRQLGASKLRFARDRERICSIMERISKNTFSLLFGESNNANKDFDSVAKIVRARKFYEHRTESKLFLIALTSLPTWNDNQYYKDNLYSVLETLTSVSRQGSYKLCREAARRLLDTIATEYGLEKKKTSTERVQDILADVTTTRDLEDMRATLLIVQRESQRLKEQFDKEVHNQNQEFTRNFFVKMNSVRHGNLLDSIARTDALIQTLQQKGWQQEPELQAIPLVIQLFINFLRSEDVTPIETVGATKIIRGCQLSNYEFLGSKIPDANDDINVVIKTPGWKMGEIIISHPQIEEVK